MSAVGLPTHFGEETTGADGLTGDSTHRFYDSEGIMAELVSTDEMQIIQKSQRERIQFQWKEYRGRTYLDVRTYFLPKGEDEWQATKKGISFKAEDFQMLVDALKSVFTQRPTEAELRGG